MSLFEWNASLLKGVRMAKAHGYKEVSVCNKQFLQVFTAMPINQWITVDNIEKYINYREIDIFPMDKSSATQRLKYKGLRENYNGEMREEDIELRDADYYEMIVRCHIYGTIFMFAALGLFDIAYTSLDTHKFGQSYFSEWDGLKAFKLTNLGCYLLGKTKEYAAPDVKENTTLVFDENALIILGEEGDKLTDTLLDNYVQKAGKNRYIVTPSSFLSDCKTTKDIENKISLFKRTVGKSKLPQNWEDFFASLLTKTQNINGTTLYDVFTLQATDKELLRLIAQEKAFRDVVLKAEGYLILVPKKQVATFKSKLKEFGYLI